MTTPSYGGAGLKIWAENRYFSPRAGAFAEAILKACCNSPVAPGDMSRFPSLGTAPTPNPLWGQAI
ncbi:hypothetical protein GCM10009540_53700 [Streptomyces turgidiscabies]